MKECFAKNHDIAKEYFDHELKIGGVGTHFSKHFEFKRIGVHHFVIPPGFRTSKPHAESLEDEFVYVISGEIDLWYNGKIKKMSPGECIGFPAGTGVGHTFINNSKGDVELFVAGDRTKAENRYRFHLESSPEKEHEKYWWFDMPLQTLGGHNGLSGDYDTSLVDNKIETFNAFKDAVLGSYSYPGDHETFGEGVCLSRRFGLKNIVINFEKLPPGKRSSWPHAHSYEEEFVYVLDGQMQVWLNGEIIPVGSKTGIDFKAGSGIAHTLLNESSEDAYYLCVGEALTDEDKIYYPQHPKRNEQMREKGYSWEDCPRKNSH